MTEPVERIRAKVEDLEIDVEGIGMRGTIKLNGVEQDWLTGLTLELSLDAPARLTLVGLIVPENKPART